MQALSGETGSFGNTFKKGGRSLITGVPKRTVYSQPGRLNRFLVGIGRPPSPEKEGSNSQRRKTEENGKLWEGY